jgi:hypothetical protein
MSGVLNEAVGHRAKGSSSTLLVTNEPEYGREGSASPPSAKPADNDDGDGSVEDDESAHGTPPLLPLASLSSLVTEKKGEWRLISVSPFIHHCL